MTIQPRPKTDKLWPRLYINYAGLEKGWYNLMDSFSKWPEIIKCGRATEIGTIWILRELFSGLWDNISPFTAVEFEDFCRDQIVNYITTLPYHPRSNDQPEMFVNTFKRAVRKASDIGSIQEATLQEFWAAYRPQTQILLTVRPPQNKCSIAT